MTKEGAIEHINVVSIQTYSSRPYVLCVRTSSNQNAVCYKYFAVEVINSQPAMSMTIFCQCSLSLRLKKKLHAMSFKFQKVNKDFRSKEITMYKYNVSLKLQSQNDPTNAYCFLPVIQTLITARDVVCKQCPYFIDIRKTKDGTSRGFQPF